MKRKKLLTLLGGICLVLILAALPFMAACAPPAPPEVIELKYAHFNKPLSLAHLYAQEPWVKQIEEATNGRVKVTIYPGATLCKPPDAYDAALTGIADMSWGFIGILATRFPLSNMVGLPLVGITDAEMGSLCLWHLYEKIPEVRAEWADTKLLLLHTHGGAPYGTNVPIRSLEDWKGLKLRTPGGGPLEVMKAVGASPMTMSPDDIYLNMEKGVIEGWTIDPEGAEARKLPEVTKYYILPYTYVGPFFIVMNLDKWNSLPRDIQEQIMSVSGEVGARFHGKAWQRALEDAEVKMGWRPEQVITLPPEEMAKWCDIAKTVWDKEVARWEAEGLPAKAVLDEMLRFIKEYK